MQNRIFIASPLFNPPQIEIIRRIEAEISAAGYDYYSARKHSGSDKLSPEERKTFAGWQPIFDSNEDGLDQCCACIAVLEYAMPEGHGLFAHSPCDLAEQDAQLGKPVVPFGKHTRIELPDAGTVWECGYLRAQGKLVFGFHTDKAKHLNLMLSHGCDGLVKGFDNLRLLLSRGTPVDHLPSGPDRRIMRYREKGERYLRQYHERHAMVEFTKALHLETTVNMFNWEAVEQFDAESKEVE